MSLFINTRILGHTRPAVRTCVCVCVCVCACTVGVCFLLLPRFGPMALLRQPSVLVSLGPDGDGRGAGVSRGGPA